ncbi:uncharacterized protein LOC133891544 [Phragmites australis]|uniref:uncharacterized protein LOC133891544 n=1 Tax=Phragmites australis TaxID=29695 RepID=UPI002D793E14|nr:uncharacterized protein LOC133891544 [Phragmites australis]
MEEETERLLVSVRNYMVFLYVGSVTASIAPRLAMKVVSTTVASSIRFLSDGYDLSVTCSFFAMATLLLQGKLARVLERRPAPAPRLTPLAAWPLAVCTWVSMTAFFLNYLTFGDDDLGGYGEWAVAGVASAVNLLMAARSVMRHLA